MRYGFPTGYIVVLDTLLSRPGMSPKDLVEVTGYSRKALKKTLRLMRRDLLIFDQCLTGRGTTMLREAVLLRPEIFDLDRADIRGLLGGALVEAERVAQERLAS